MPNWPQYNMHDFTLGSMYLRSLNAILTKHAMQGIGYV